MSYHEEFASLNEFLNTVQKREQNRVFKNKYSSRDGSKSFTGTESLEEADKLLTYGWDEGFRRVLELEKFAGIRGFDGTVPRVRPANAVAGFVPNIPNAIRNLPDSMINLKREPRKVKVQVINLINSVHCGVSSDDLMREMLKLYRYIYDTELNGVRTEVRIFSGAKSQGQNFTFSIKIKDPKDILNKKKMCYLMANPSFFRRHCFQWIERIPVPVPEGMCNGYGTPPKAEDFKGLKNPLDFHMLSNFSQEALANYLNK